MSFHWFVLLAAIAVEVVATSSLKATAGAASHIVAVLPLVLIGLSFGLLSIALRVIPVAVAYAVWEGLGIIGIAAVGRILFGEDLSVMRAVALVAILGGILLLERGAGCGAEREGER
ncbi:multidrug efflux SMR transporter [Chelatococcus sp. SYSU_G07232]|uniref:Spermidine export protein MdtJ n=1 Tax=Chelatococcus albus TaxID=3047466 RepID=A0ABT7AKL7_9HYPH|nr:multidrug efflux SMR transporter [Chelatococcus sp. SYSU_G07232]MDJ1159655.1 multidrug efflux SMR transporter [Chelatococcus sp. SYSU_G07232]